MSTALAIFGWLLAGVGMVFHLVGVALGLWGYNYGTYAIALVGFALMLAGGASSA